MNRISMLERMLKAYIECALWSTNDESRDDGGDPLDNNYGPDDIAAESLAAMRADCEAFLKANADDIENGGLSCNVDPHNWDPYEQAGHDLWLNRNGHGCGFWDGDWPEPQASRLDAAAEAMGHVDLYVGNDGRIYQS